MSDDKPTTFDEIKQRVSEEDTAPQSGAKQTLWSTLGGNFLSAKWLRRQVWLIVLIVVFASVYVASTYQCQQDLMTIDKLEKQHTDAKYKALSAASSLTERTRESHVLNALKQTNDSMIKASAEPPYIVEVPTGE